MMKLGYYQPLSGGEATASGLGSLGQTMSSLGQLSLDEKERARKESFENTKLNLMQKESDLKEMEVTGKNKYYDDKVKETQQERLDKAIKAKNMVAAFRVAHPNATKNMSDDELMAWGNDIDKLLPKDKKIDKIDTRVTPDGDKMLTYMEDGVIKERNMGKVKTDWNESKKSSDIPANWISTGFDFYQKHKKGGTFKQTGDGRFIAPIEFVNQKLAEDHDLDSDKLLSKNYEDE